jgi:hypothetical protein
LAFREGCYFESSGERTLGALKLASLLAVQVEHSQLIAFTKSIKERENFVSSSQNCFSIFWEV